MTIKNSNSKEDENSEPNLEYFANNDRFIDYIRATKMYQEIWNSKEGIISVVVALIVSFFLIYIFAFIPKFNPTDNLLNILGIIIGGAFGLLGFLVGGMALIVGSISDEMIDIVDKGGQFKSLLSIIFRFYYDGVLIAMLIIVSFISYFMLMLPSVYNIILISILGFFNSFLFFYALILSVMLLGTSIRLMILRHSFSRK